MPVLARMYQRRASASVWTAINPILHEGEWGLEVNTGRTKIGNGIDEWTELDYASPSTAEVQSIADLVLEEDQGARRATGGDPTAFYTKPVGGPVPVETDSGRAVTVSGANASAWKITDDGMMVDSGTGAAYWYFTSTNQLLETRLVWRFNSAPGAVDGAAVMVGGFDSAFPNTATVKSACHLVINRTTWTYQVIDTGPNFITLASGVFAGGLPYDTTLRAHVSIHGDSAIVDLPDGTRTVVSHPLIGSVSNTIQCVEIDRAAFPTARAVTILSHYSLGGPRRGNSGARDRRIGRAPEDNGLIAEAFPVHSVSGSVPLAANNTVLSRVFVPAGKTISKLAFGVAAAGAGVTNGFLGVLEADGTRAGLTANVSTTLQSAGNKVVDLTAVIASKPVDRYVYVAVTMTAASTAPQLWGLSAAVVLHNVNQTAPGLNGSYIGGGTIDATEAVAGQLAYAQFYVGLVA